MNHSTRILGDINETRPKDDFNQRTGSAGPWRSDRASTVPATEIPLTHDQPMERESGSPRRSNGGLGGLSGRSLRTDWSDTPATYEPRGPKGRGSGIAALILLLAVAGLIWYDSPQILQTYQYISRLPATEEAMKNLQSRANATETQLRSLTENWGSLENQLTKLDRRVSSGLTSARKHADELVAQAQTKVEAELNQRTEAMNARLDKVESAETDTRNQLADTQDQLQKEVGALRQQVAELSGHTDQNVAKLEQEVGQNQSGLAALGQKVNRRRVDFEVGENVTVELAPGVSLTVLKTNVSYQSFDGFLSLTNHGRTVWLSNAGISRAVSFYPEPSDPPYALVVTGIRPKGVVGYLMVPEAEGQG
jgi:chaperonin cofactor prefoldin